MNRLLVLIFTLAFYICLVGCSKDKDPSVRIRNERGTKANIQLKAADGNTININDVEGGATTAFQDIAVTRYEVKATIQSETVTPSITFDASTNNNYTVVVLPGTPPILRVEVAGK